MLESKHELEEKSGTYWDFGTFKVLWKDAKRRTKPPFLNDLVKLGMEA